MQIKLIGVINFIPRAWKSLYSDLFNVRWKSVKKPSPTEHPRERSAFADRLSRINIDPFRVKYPLVRHGITESVCTKGGLPRFWPRGRERKGEREKGIYVWGRVRVEKGRARVLCFRSVLQIVVTISCFVRNARARCGRSPSELYYGSYSIC